MATVLLVDEDRNFRWTLKLLLETDGYQVDEAADAFQAAEILSHRAYDVVVTDLHFARGTGLDVLGAIAGTPTRSVVITVPPSVGQDSQSVPATPADRYIEKPSDVMRLLEVIREAAFDSETTPSTLAPASVPTWN